MDQPRSLWELAASPAPAAPDAPDAPAADAAGRTPDAPATPDATPAPPRPRLVARVLDAVRGAPAVGIAVVFETVDAGGMPVLLGTAPTAADGRAALVDGPGIGAAYYRVTFDVARYFADRGTPTCYPAISVLLQVTDASRDVEVPLLVSPHGYSTYRA